MTLFLIKYVFMISVCRLSLFFLFLMISSPLNNDFSGFSTNNPLALPPVFVLALLLRDLDKYSLIKFILISYYLSSFISSKLFTLLKSFCLLVFAQEGSRSLIFKDAG